jgi:hypothetical protein
MLPNPPVATFFMYVLGVLKSLEQAVRLWWIWISNVILAKKRKGRTDMNLCHFHIACVIRTSPFGVLTLLPFRFTLPITYPYIGTSKYRAHFHIIRLVHSSANFKPRTKITCNFQRSLMSGCTPQFPHQSTCSYEPHYSHAKGSHGKTLNFGRKVVRLRHFACFEIHTYADTKTRFFGLSAGK